MDSHLPPGPERLLQHADALRRLARRLVRDDAEADDLVQETWTSVLEKPRDVEPAAGWRRWLFGIARNLARERARSDGRRVRRESAVARSELDGSGVEIVEQLESFRVLADELARLDEPYRSTLYRRFFESQSNARIAETDGIEEASVRSRHARGLALLRERLDRRHGGRRGAWLILLQRIAADEPVQAAARPLLIWCAASALLVVVGWLAIERSVRREPDEVALVAPGSGVSVEQAGNVLAPVESAGSTRVVLAPTSIDEPASLRLVDMRTGAPLGGFALHLGFVGSTITRPDGTVTLPADAFQKGVDGGPAKDFELSMTLVDDPRLDALRRAHQGGRSFPWTISVPFAPDARACTLQVAVGPSFHVRFAQAPAMPIGSLMAELLSSDSGSMRATSTAPLREPLVAGGLPWVRFLDEAAYLGGSPPYRLRIGDEDGMWCGEAFVEDLSRREEILVALEPRGTLRVETLDEHGAPLRASVTFERDGRAVARAENRRETAFLPWLEPGDGELVVACAGRATLRRPVRITAGTERIERAVLAPLPGAQRVSGRVPGESRALRFDLENESTHERLEVAGTRAGDDIVFEFAAVPEGTWRLRAQGTGIWRWNPPLLSVTPPAQDLVLRPVELAARETRALKLRAFDARTGERVDHFQADLACDGEQGERAVKLTGFGNLVFESVPLDAPLLWTLSAEGYRHARGDRAALRRDGDHDLVVVHLERGWERDVVVRDAATRAPIAGARVIADGVAAGVTDANGVCSLERESAPRRIVVDLDGWRLAGGSLGAGESIRADGAWSSATPTTVTAFLERR